MDLVKKYLDDHKIDFYMVTESVMTIWHNDTFFEIFKNDTKYIIKTCNEGLDFKVLETSFDVGNLIFKLAKILNYPR